MSENDFGFEIVRKEEKRHALFLDCVLVLHMGAEPKHMDLHLLGRPGLAPWMVYNAHRFIQIWDSSKARGEPMTQILCKAIETNGTKQQSFVSCLILLALK